MAEDVSDSPAGFAKEQLKSFIERIERLEEEKKAIADDIKDVFAEAKANGFDVKALRTILKIRKEDVDERKEHEAKFTHLGLIWKNDKTLCEICY